MGGRGLPGACGTDPARGDRFRQGSAERHVLDGAGCGHAAARCLRCPRGPCPQRPGRCCRQQGRHPAEDEGALYPHPAAQEKFKPYLDDIAQKGSKHKKIDQRGTLEFPAFNKKPGGGVVTNRAADGILDEDPYDIKVAIGYWNNFVFSCTGATRWEKALAEASLLRAHRDQSLGDEPVRRHRVCRPPSTCSSAGAWSRASTTATATSVCSSPWSSPCGTPAPTKPKWSGCWPGS